MKFDDLKEGYRIEYKFLSEEQLKYAQTPVMNLKDAEKRMQEMKEDLTVTDFVIFKVKYYIK